MASCYGVKCPFLYNLRASPHDIALYYESNCDCLLVHHRIQCSCPTGWHNETLCSCPFHLDKLHAWSVTKMPRETIVDLQYMQVCAGLQRRSLLLGICLLCKVFVIDMLGGKTCGAIKTPLFNPPFMG